MSSFHFFHGAIKLGHSSAFCVCVIGIQLAILVDLVVFYHHNVAVMIGDAQYVIFARICFSTHFGCLRDVGIQC